MGQRVNLLRSLPKTTRDVAARSAAKGDRTVVSTAKTFEHDYFDGDRKFGYGGYHYDKRWKPVVVDIMSHYRLHHGSRVLDIGCAKGFLVRDMRVAGLRAFGLDVSNYAVCEAPHPDVVGYLHRGEARRLPFPDDSFDLVVSINTLHNLPSFSCRMALREITRVSRGAAFVQVDAYETDEQRERFLSWVLTAETHGTPEFWLELFNRADYEGDYDWTVV